MIKCLFCNIYNRIIVAYDSFVLESQYRTLLVMLYGHELMKYIKYVYWKSCIPGMPYIVYKVNKGTLMNDSQSIKISKISKDFFNGFVPKQNNDFIWDYIEYRVMYKFQKYRIFSLKGNIIEPTLHLLQSHGMKSPLNHPRIIGACLTNKVNDLQENVLDKILKYAGPNHDFFGQKVKPKWMFNKQVMIDGEHDLCIFYTNGSIHSFSTNEFVKKF
jgi:hypothetical protein